ERGGAANLRTGRSLREEVDPGHDRRDQREDADHGQPAERDADAPVARRARILGPQRRRHPDRRDDQHAEAEEDRGVDRLPERGPVDDRVREGHQTPTATGCGASPNVGCSEIVSSGSTAWRLFARHRRKQAIARITLTTIAPNAPLPSRSMIAYITPAVM